MWMRKPTPVTTRSMTKESWSRENAKSTLKSPERSQLTTNSVCGSAREENCETIHKAMANAAPQKVSATAATAPREKRLPKNPLRAAPAKGSKGISQRYRFGGVIV